MIKDHSRPRRRTDISVSRRAAGEENPFIKPKLTEEDIYVGKNASASRHSEFDEVFVFFWYGLRCGRHDAFERSKLWRIQLKVQGSCWPD